MLKSEKQILGDFKRYLKLKSIRTFKSYIIAVNEFFDFLGDKEISYNEVTAGTGDEYRAYLLRKEKAIARATINNKMGKLKSFYEFLFIKRLICINPFKHTKNLHAEKSIPKNILSVEDMGMLLDNFSIKRVNDIMLKSIIELLYGSSLRISEAMALKKDDIDFEGGFLLVTNFKDNERKWKAPATEISLREVKKYMNKARDMILTAEELKAGYLYPQKKWRRTNCMLNAKLKQECRRLGLKEISSHSFRHSSATHMLRSGAGIRQVQALLGHQRISSTERYTRVIKEDLKKVVETCHPRERSETCEEEIHHEVEIYHK